MKLLENYRNKIKELKDEYTQDYICHYDKNYLKKAVDLLQEEIYTIFPSSICFYVALLQKYLTDGLDFYWREPECFGTYIDDIDYEDDEQNITISVLKEVIEEINSLCWVCTIGDFEEDTLQTIDNLLNCIFDDCCRWIKYLFPKENIELFESSSFREVQDIIKVCKFSGCRKYKEEEKIKNSYSLNIVDFLKNHRNSLKENVDSYQYDELTEQLNLSVVEKYRTILDGVLIGNSPILSKNNLHIENIWHFTKSNKSEWTYYIHSLEYLRTVVIQAISEEAISGTYELCFSRIEKSIIDEITNAIVFCMSNGKIRKYNCQDNIVRKDFRNIKELDDENFIVTQYFRDNLLYLYEEFNKSKTFTEDEKQYMANCLYNIHLISCKM